jgi:hypothetical protein
MWSGLTPRADSPVTIGSKRQHPSWRSSICSDTVVLLRLPDRMLARPGQLPSGSGWSFELKWDGFRAIVSTEDGLRVRSRRGWRMTPVLPELRIASALEGELRRLKPKPTVPPMRHRSAEPSVWWELLRA